MNDIDSILRLWRAEPARTAGAVLVTVVHVEGSAYRRPGARMLILAGGTRIGMVSGGCLESEVARKAKWFTRGGEPMVRAYDTSSDNDTQWEFGLGCNGVVHVLFERFDSPSTREMLEFVSSAHSSRGQAVVATVIQSSSASRARVGDRLLVSSAGARAGKLSGTSLESEILPHVEDCFLRAKGVLAHLSDCAVFIECISPPVELILFGAGYDTLPVVTFAKELGWHVTVADARPAFALASRFPAADRVMLLARDNLLSGISVSPDSVVVLMTHNLSLDAELVRRLLPLQPRYIGLLGPRTRASKLMEQAGGPSLESTEIHAPVGLDLGGDTPAAIALSIIGEIQAFLHGRPGSNLKYLNGAIHAPARVAGERQLSLTPLMETAACELA